MRDLITPVVNGNGTSAEELIRQRLTITSRLDKVIEVMCAAMPHGRDYQTHPKSRELGGYDPIGREARGAWEDRIEMLRLLRIELNAEAMEIHDQIDWSTGKRKVAR